ncbi:hypothetical protein NFI96_001724, partial [Prochilodus magdalenae]
MDFITGLPMSRGNSVILVIVDRFSKAARFIGLPKLPSAQETARIVLQQVVRYHGIPTDIVSDRGPQFTSRVWRAFCGSLGVNVSLSSGFHPQSNGQTERVNQDLGRSLRCLTSSNPEYAHNTLFHSSLGMSPFECQFGYTPPMFPEAIRLMENTCKKIPLPPVYTREFIPANRTHIPTNDAAKAWSHLEHLQDELAPLQDCEA